MHTLLARGHPATELARHADRIEVHLCISLYTPPRGITVADLTLRESLSPPSQPLLSKNISDSAATAEDPLSRPPDAPPLRRFHSHQGGDGSPDAALEGEEVQYRGDAAVTGAGDEWRIVIFMREWARAPHADAESVEITAKILIDTPGGDTLPPVRLTFRMTLATAHGGQTAAVFGAFTSRVLSGAEIYHHLLGSVMGGPGKVHKHLSLPDAASLHRALLEFVSTGVPAASSPISLDGALSALALFATKHRHDSLIDEQLGIHLLCMVGQLAERFFHGRRDDYQHRIGDIESFRQNRHLIRRCQVICGPISDSLWGFIQRMDIAAVAPVPASVDFSTTRLLRMGALFLFHSDVYSLVPCYRSVSCPVVFNDFSGAAAVITNSYASAFHDWNLVARLSSIRPDHAVVIRLFNARSTLLTTDRDAFIAEVFRSFTVCRRLVEQLGHVLQVLDAISSKWDDDFAPAFAIETVPEMLLELPLCYGDHDRVQAPEVPGFIALRVRKTCVEARYFFGGLCESLDATMEMARTFTSAKDRSKALVKEEYRSGARNFLTEFRSEEEALSVNAEGEAYTKWCGDGRKGEHPTTLQQSTPASTVQFKTPQGLCCLPDGALLVADWGNHSILSMPSPRECSRVTNSKMKDVIALNRPRAIVQYKEEGTFLIADTANHCVRLLRTTEAITAAQLPVVAGKCGFSGALNGVGTAATFLFPSDIVMFQGKCVVCDRGNHVLRGIAINDTDFNKSLVVTIAGCPGEKSSIDGTVFKFSETFRSASKETKRSKSPVSAARLCNPSVLVGNEDGSGLYICEQSPPAVRYYDGTKLLTIYRGAPLSQPAGICMYNSSASSPPALLIADQDSGCIWQLCVSSGELSPFITAETVLREIGPCAGPVANKFMPASVRSPAPGCVVFVDTARNAVFRFLNKRMCVEAVAKMRLRNEEENSFFTPFVTSLVEFASSLDLVFQRTEVSAMSLLSDKLALVSGRYRAAVADIIRNRGRQSPQSLDTFRVLILAAPSVSSVRDALQAYRVYDCTSKGFCKEVFTVLVTKLSKIEFGQVWYNIDEELAALADILSAPELGNRDAQDLLCAILRNDKYVFPVTESTLKVVGVVLGRERFTLDRVMVSDLRREAVRWLNRLELFAPVGKRIEDHTANVQHFSLTWLHLFKEQHTSERFTDSMATSKAMSWLCRVHLDSVALYPALYQVHVLDRGKEIQTSKSVDRSLMTLSSLSEILQSFASRVITGDTLELCRLISILRTVFAEALHTSDLDSAISVMLSACVETIETASVEAAADDANSFAFGSLFACVHSELLTRTIDKHFAVVLERVTQQTAAEKPDRDGSKKDRLLSSKEETVKVTSKEKKDPDADIQGHVLVYEPKLWADFLRFWCENSPSVSRLLTRASENSCIKAIMKNFIVTDIIENLSSHYSTLFRLFSKNWEEVTSGTITIDGYKRVYNSRCELLPAWKTVTGGEEGVMLLMENIDREIQNFYACLSVVSTVLNSLSPALAAETTLAGALKKNWGLIRLCDVRTAFNPSALTGGPELCGSVGLSIPSECTIKYFPLVLLDSLDWLNYCVSEGSFFIDFWHMHRDTGSFDEIPVVASHWSRVWVMLSEFLITFRELETYSSYALDRIELSCIARACWYRCNESCGPESQWKILEDSAAESEEAAVKVQSLLEKVAGWKHLQNIVSSHSSLMKKLKSLRHFVVKSEVVLLEELEENICSLHADYLLPTWSDRVLGSSDDLYNLANGVHGLVFNISSELLDSIRNHPKIIDWLRCFQNDDDFRTALEMALGKSEMECPIELWDSSNGRVDEQYLSRLRNIRSYLHKYLYGNDKTKTLENVLQVFGQLNENVDPLTIADNVLSCEQVCTPLMSLIEVQGYSEGVVPSRLLQLYTAAHEAAWMCAIDSSCSSSAIQQGNVDAVLRLQYKVLVANADSDGMATIQDHSFSELQDFQSTVVLSKSDSAEDNNTQQLFLNQFARMGKLALIVMQLHNSGHPSAYPTCRLEIPVCHDVEYFEKLLLEWGNCLFQWQEQLLMLKRNHFFMNYFVVKRIQCLVRELRIAVTDEAHVLTECIALINPTAAHDLELISCVREKLASHFAVYNDTTDDDADYPVDCIRRIAVAMDDAFMKIPVQERRIETVPEAIQLMSLSNTLFSGSQGRGGVRIIESEGYLDAGNSVVDDSDHRKYQKDERTDELLLVLSVYAGAQRLPEAEEILLCDENTTFETVENFVYLWSRAHHYGRESRIFCLVGCYLLRYEVQDPLTALIRELESDAKCALIISTCPSENSGLLATALSHRPKQRIMALAIPMLKKYMCEVGSAHAKGMELYSSQYAGAGKSFSIRTRCALSCQRYVLCSVNSGIDSSGVSQRINSCMKIDDGSIPRENNHGILLHVDISNSATWSVCECIFKLCLLGILNDPEQTVFYYWNKASTSFCIEVASDVPDSVRSFLSIFPFQVISTSEDSFCCNREALLAGMGEDMFHSSLYDATSGREGVHDAYHRLRFVYSVLATLSSKRGIFPYSLTECYLSPAEEHDGGRCYTLLLEASDIKVNTSLHCLWSFINVVFWQLTEMHHPESPLNAACMPDPLSHNIDDVESKAKIKGQIMQFIFKTAREFATRLTGVVRGRRIVQCRVNGLSRSRFNNRWQRCHFDNDGEPCFSIGRGEFFLYYRRKSNTWVIDDILEPEGPVYSSSNSKALEKSQWTTSPGWESSRRQISVTKVNKTAGFKGEGVTVQGCGSLRNGSCTSAEDGLYLRQLENINSQAHYIKEGPKGGQRRHLFWETEKGCWQVSDICNDDQGAHILCNGLSALDGHGDWKSIPPDIKEQAPDFELIYEDDSAVMSSSAATTDGQLEEGQLEGLHVELLRWQDSNHECIFFNNENHVVTFLSMNPAVLRRTMHPSLLKHLENNRIVVGDDLVSLASSPQHFQNILGGLTGVIRSPAEAASMIDGYCMTGDSLLKMLAIVYRIRCGVPVVLMGECGCGKTMLISYLTKWLGVRLITLDIHGGTTEDDIINVFTSATAHLGGIQTPNLEPGARHDIAIHEVYIFLDEVNTCSHMGVIAEAVCHRTINGVRLPEGIKILAALNPYRLKPVPVVTEGTAVGLNYSNNSTLPTAARSRTARKKAQTGDDPIKRLVYRVHPIPQLLQDFIFDFGALDYKTEKMYISFMIDKELSLCKTLEKDFATEIISGCQFAIRGFEGDSSAVSLRDVKRCLSLISWFAKYWPGGPRARTHISLFGRSLVLAVAHVYLYRLSSVQMRAQFWSKVAAITKDFGRKVDQIRCAELGQSSFPQAVLKRVQKNFSDTFTVDTGIAMNEALTENIYVIVVCILNKIPVFVVGKPGTSKTLALQVIASNLQGAQSPHATWRRFPAVYLFQYQCSPLSTAKSIHFQFEAAKSYQASAEDVITVLLLDEVGLAEHSPDMPLKVLHYMLVDPPIGIVGLSNWTLDSSKMNRAICLQRPEPSVDDMMLTGQNIVCALDGAGVPLGEDDPPPVPTLARQNSKPGARRMSPWLINLSRAFHKIYRAQSEHSNGRREFIGMRDYYCLLKMFRNDVGMPVDDTGTNVDEHTISVPSLLYNVSRNLGGKPNDMQHILSTFFVECFRQRMEVEKLNFDDIKSFVPTSTRLIQDSLQALHNRHLMLLTRNSAALSLLFSCDILRESDVTVLIGSRFQKDLAELRLIQQINEIKNAMLDGRVVVLLNHDSIYESLYDVLNQRYVTRTDPVTGKVKRMLRLAIGPRSQLCPVNDGFKIVVVVEQYHAYDNLDLPLLNRFEKQVFLYDSVLNAHEKACVASLTEWVESLLGETDLGYPDELFAGYHAETIPSLILYLTKKMPVDGSTQSPTDNVDVICAAKLALLRISLPVVPLRFPNLFADGSVDPVRSAKINIDLLATLHSELGLFPECSKVDTEFSKHASLTVAMTHSPVGHFSACKLAHQMSSHAETLEVLELQLSLISSEKQITDFLEGYYSIESSSCQNKMLCILCDPQENDLSIISHVKYLCVKYNMLYKRLFASLPPSTQQSHFRHVSIIVHLPPGMCTTVGRRDYTIDFQLPWGYLFIDDIRPMSSESINEMNELTSKSAFDLCRSGGILNLFDTIVFKYQSALARCVTPAITSKNMSFRTGVRNAQIVKFLMCFPEFMLFLQEAILACLESCCHAGFDSPNRPPFHVQIACSDPFVAGTLKESLLLALESLIVQSLSHIFRNLDRNFNFNSLAPVVGNYAHSVSEAPLNLSETESSTVNKWLSLCLRLVDIGSIGRSCSLYSPSELHQADCSVANTGLHDDGLVCQFPFSERIMRLIGTDETRQNVEKVTENSIDGGSADNMIPPLRAILSSFLGEQFWASSILSNVDNDASNYSYVFDFVSCRVSPHKHLSLTDHVEVFSLLALATTTEKVDLDMDPVAVQASYWANEARYFHIMNGLSMAIRSTITPKQLSRKLCFQLTEVNSPGYKKRFTADNATLEVEYCINNFYLQLLISSLKEVLEGAGWDKLKEWESFFISIYSDLEGLVIGLLSTISRKAVANHLSETDIDVLMHGIVIPFRSIRAAAAVVCEMRLDCTSGESQQSIEKYMYDLLPLALQYDVLGLDMKKSPFLHYCIGEGQGEDLFALRCSILQRICTDVLETELRLYDASPLCFLIDEDLLVQLQSCISISFPNGQSSQMKSWLPLAKSFYCILFNVMKRVPVVYSFLKAVVRGPSPLSIPIMQFYLQKIQDFGEVTLDHFGSGDGRLSDLSELVLDETVFQRVETIATSRFWLDKYCDSLLDYLASGGESILNADISAAIAPGAEVLDLLRNVDANFYVLRCLLSRGGPQLLLSYFGGRRLPVRFEGLKSLGEVAHKSVSINLLACVSLPNSALFEHVVGVVERVLFGSKPVSALTELLLRDQLLCELPTGHRICLLVAAFASLSAEAKKNDTNLGTNLESVKKWIQDIRTDAAINEHVVHHSFRKVVEWLFSGYPSFNERTDSLLTGGVAANRRSLSAHICTLVAEFPTCWVGTLLMSASAFADEFVPSMPNDELLALSNALGYVGWYTCQNGHPYVVGNCTYPMETARCSVCNARIGGTNHNTLSGTKRFDPSQRKQCKGYNLTATLPADSYDVQDAHRCGMLTTSVLRYILHLTLVTSMGFGESPAAAVTRFIFPTSTDTAKTYHTLIMLLEQDWAQLKKISKYTDTDLSLALHLTLSDYMKGMRRSSSQGGSLWYCIENNDSRDGFETSFERVCSVYFSKADSLSLVREVAGSLSGLSQYTAIRKCLGEAEAAIYLHRENELSMSKLLKYRLLRYREPVNFEAFNFHFSLNREHANSYPLLAAILKAEEKLSLLGYLTDILAWHRVLFNILKPGSVERGDALYISNADVIARIPEAEREAASMLLNNYCVAFNRTLKLVPFLFECNANPFLASNGEVDLSGSQRGDGTGEKMSPGTSVKFSLPSIVSGEQDATGLCSIQIINALQQTHNEVLEGLLELKRKYDNSNSSPCKNESGVTTRKKVVVSTFRTDLGVLGRKLINYDRRKHLLPVIYCFAYQKLGCVEGSLEGFDFSRIEQSISRTLLATTELINVHVCQFQYAGELQSTGVLRMLPERVQQVPLSASLLNRIQQEVDTRVRLVKLLTQIEECVSFVVSTGNSGVIDVDGNVLLENYICDVLLVPDAVWGEISCPTIASHVHLKHLRALLQALERWLLGDPLDAVVLKYREPYEGVVSPEDIRTVAMAEGCATFTAGLFDLLTEQLSRDTWPADACLKEYVGYRDEDICDVEAYEVFPDTLCLCHAYSVYKFLLSGSCVS